MLIILAHFCGFFFKDLIYLFLEKGEGREKEERNINQLPFIHTPTRDQTCNPGMCPDWESNQQPFALQDNAQPTEPHRPGHISVFTLVCYRILEKHLRGP